MAWVKMWLWGGVLLGLMGRLGAQEAAPALRPTAQPGISAPASAGPQVDANGSGGKKGKVSYAGPETVVELASTPMLDEEGKQRLDPEGKPMFNPPVRQQRDKKGHPLFDDAGKPVMQTPTDLGYDEHGKKLKAKKEKAPKTVSVAIERGTLTVDGMIGKAGLNYDIADLRYIYFFAPWVGTVVVSNAAFPGAKEQAKAFEGKTLTVTVDEHTFQLYSDKVLLGKGKPEPGYVLVNREFQLPSKMPVMGYGATLRPPYAWPGAKEAKTVTAYAPPVPEGLRPVALLPACPPGQMRPGAQGALPGEKWAAQPCVAIAGNKAADAAPPPQ